MSSAQTFASATLSNYYCALSGVGALRAVDGGRFGQMVALRGNAIVEVALADALAAPRLLDPELYETVEIFFG